jgi:hypothetical protein
MMGFVSPEAEADLQNRFSYHAPDEFKIQRHTRIRSDAYKLALQIVENCPESREQSLALTKLEEVVMWANAAIARMDEEGARL